MKFEISFSQIGRETEFQERKGNSREEERERETVRDKLIKNSFSLPSYLHLSLPSSFPPLHNFKEKYCCLSPPPSRSSSQLFRENGGGGGKGRERDNFCHQQWTAEASPRTKDGGCTIPYETTGVYCTHMDGGDGSSLPSGRSEAGEGRGGHAGLAISNNLLSVFTAKKSE